MNSHKEKKVFSYFNIFAMCLSVKIWFEIGLKVKKMIISFDFYCCCMLMSNGLR